MLKCSHCRSLDTVDLFNSVECLNCGRHTTLDGKQILPDSLCVGPNIPENLEQYGWPYEDPSPSHARSDEMLNAQWGVPLKETA